MAQSVDEADGGWRQTAQCQSAAIVTLVSLSNYLHYEYNIINVWMLMHTHICIKDG